MDAKTNLLACTIAALAMGFMPSAASAAVYAIHMGGLCSTQFAGGKGGGSAQPIGSAIAIDAQVNQTRDHGTAVQQFKQNYLDTYCTGNNFCYLYVYSNGGAVATQALSVYDNGQYNIYYVVANGSNEGGSELSDFGAMSEWATCDMGNEVGPSVHRNSYNHHDTGGETIYTLAGYNGYFWSSWRLPGEDDGIVAMHSAGGYTSSGSRDHQCGSSRWTNHVPAWDCDFNKEHDDMKMTGHNCFDGHSCG